MLVLRDYGIIFIFTLLTQTITANMESKSASILVSKFATKFVAEINKETSLVSSPLSLEYLLGLLTLGTSGEAQKELLSLLGLDDENAIRNLFKVVSAKLKVAKGVTLNVANKIYLKDGSYELYPEIKKDAIEVFDAEIEKLNFSQQGAADLINKWVEIKTNNKIKELFASNDINGDTQVVLLNAVYFKGTWKKQFDKANTQEQVFHVNKQTTAKVQMMYKEDKFKYHESKIWDAQFLELPYEGDEMSMLIILPKEIEGIVNVLEKFKQGHDIVSELEQMHPVKVKTSIPKFKIETEIDVKDTLIELGVISIFDRENSGITKFIDTRENLYVSKAIQKAVIEVNEEGTEAAAATGVVMRTRRSVEPPSAEFVCDRPALWCLLGARRVLLAVRYQPPTPSPRDEL